MVDRFTVYFLILLPAAALVALLASIATARDRELPAGEYGFLVLASLTGALTLAGARDLITLIVGLETLTLPTYVLVGLRRSDRRSGEAAIKYLLVSVVSTAVTLLGTALIYGLTGAVHLDRIAAALDGRDDLRSVPLTGAAVLLVLVGFGFKIAAVPFHWWAPDVYSGAPVPVAAYLATVSKAGGVAGLVVLLVGAFPSYANVWGPLLVVLAVASLLIGNLVALRQRTVVRLLAWSSVAHAGYLLVPLGAAVTARGRDGAALSAAADATLGYLALYVAINLGAFCCLAAVDRHHPDAELDDCRGLAARSPWLAGGFAFFLVGLAGLPPGLAGLFAKVVVVGAAADGGAGWLAVLVAVGSVIGLAYYLRLAGPMFQSGTGGRLAVAPSLVAALVVAAGVTLVLGFAPNLVLDAVPFAGG